MDKSQLASVDIVIPVYNASQSIRYCIDAVLTQSHKNFRMILIDDGSTDGSFDICEEYAKRYPNIKLVHQNNSGVSAARNQGLNLVKADFFTFIDSDDLIYSSCVSDLVDAALEHDSDLVTANIFRTKNIHDRVPGNDVNLAYDIAASTAIEELLYGRRIKNHPVARLYRSDKLSSVRFDETISIGEDMDYTFRCLRKVNKVTLVDKVLYNYINKEGSAMNSNFTATRADSFRAARKIYEATGGGDASISKLFDEAFAIATLARPHRNSFEKIYIECSRVSKKLAFQVFCNSKVRLRQRVYAFLVILNVDLALLIAGVKRRFRG
ncbi:glycosyltransferase [Patescibacteria group bacterium]|nr:glycosyltransferase [Patescibacteria group bacterium]